MEVPELMLNNGGSWSDQVISVSFAGQAASIASLGAAMSGCKHMSETIRCCSNCENPRSNIDNRFRCRPIVSSSKIALLYSMEGSDGDRSPLLQLVDQWIS